MNSKKTIVIAISIALEKNGSFHTIRLLTLKAQPTFEGTRIDNWCYYFLQFFHMIKVKFTAPGPFSEKFTS